MKQNYFIEYGIWDNVRGRHWRAETNNFVPSVNCSCNSSLGGMEVKKKVVSMMLALTLVFSEIPAYTANAAENPSDNVEEDGTETSKTEEDRKSVV